MVVSSAQPATVEVGEPGPKRSAAKLLTHLLHLVSSIVVLAIVVHYYHVIAITWLGRFWLLLASTDILVCILVLYRTLLRCSTPHLSILMFVLSNLWLLALVLSAIEYAHSACGQTAHGGWVACPVKRAHMAFEALAFLLSFLTMVAEWRRWTAPRMGRSRSNMVVEGSGEHMANPVVTPRTSYTAA